MDSVTSLPPAMEGRPSVLVPLYAHASDPEESLRLAVRKAFHALNEREWQKARGIAGTGAA